MKNKAKHRKMAKRVLGYLEAFPEKHDQDSYIGNPETVRTGSVCNTTMCVAGTAVFLDGGPEALQHILFEAVPGPSDNFDDVAGKLLGLNEDEAHSLFYEFSEKRARKALRAVAKGNEEKFHKIIGL